MTPIDKPWTVETAPLSVVPSLQQYPIQNVFKVAILGAESTGKTTLCQDLAYYFDTHYTIEFMRPYLQQKWDLTQTPCEWQDLMPIAEGQMAEENAKAQQANRYLFCDTTLFELMVYAYWYYDKCPQPIEAAANNHRYDLILLTEVDVPWEADDLRDAPHQRHEISQAFEQALTAHHRPFKKIGGNREQRVNTVTQYLNTLS
ncbi:AAA family ATPase [Psychrobacter sanguinis]|uniref:AAA family ATPase n=1 Tax=Psychrobacter sanguinis TaxID=861445 RepID=UPI00191B4617|nr:ATP-binding protein [Psychrobacter sanguinis]MCC3344271.1 ATP-binding protein [Psychrobacter sanguinis]